MAWPFSRGYFDSRRKTRAERHGSRALLCSALRRGLFGKALVRNMTELSPSSPLDLHGR